MISIPPICGSGASRTSRSIVEVVGCWPQCAAGNPPDKLDDRVALWICGLSDRGDRGVEDLATLGDGRFALATEFPHSALTFTVTSRHGVPRAQTEHLRLPA